MRVGVDSASRLASATPATGRLAGEEIAGAGVGSGVACVSAGGTAASAFSGGASAGASSGGCIFRGGLRRGLCFCWRGGYRHGFGSCLGLCRGRSSGHSHGHVLGHGFRSRLGAWVRRDRGNIHGRGYGSRLGFCWTGRCVHRRGFGFCRGHVFVCLHRGCGFGCSFGDRLGRRLGCGFRFYRGRSSGNRHGHVLGRDFGHNFGRDFGHRLRAWVRSDRGCIRGCIFGGGLCFYRGHVHRHGFRDRLGSRLGKRRVCLGKLSPS